MGIGRKFQTPTVFDSLTTYQNMELALPGNQNWLTNLYKQITSEENDQILFEGEAYFKKHKDLFHER